MSNALSITLTPAERSELAALVNHRGWAVLTKIMQGECQAATADCIKADPTEEKKVLALQLNARATNAFCTRLLAGIAFQVNEGLYEEQEQAEAQLEAEANA